MQVNERDKGKIRHLSASELELMSRIENIPEKAKEEFKRKPYEVKKCLSKKTT